jgi:hypothetical protein
MDTCGTCGESVRKGLVRCWNCGSFTRKEIEESYRQRQEAAPSGDDRSFDLPELDASSVTELDSAARRLATPENLLAAPPMAREEDEGDDFELSDDVQMSDADDSAFDLADAFQMRSGGLPVETDSSPVFSLQSLPDAPVPASLPPVDTEMETIPLLGASVTEPAAAESAEAPTIPLSPLGGAVPPRETAKPAATPEDELLKIAAAEEAEISKIRKGMRSKDTFVVFCPQGHRIRVREKFRGKQGKCPRCQSVFIVPQKEGPKPKKKTDVEIPTMAGGAPVVKGRYARWLDDVHLHTVVPEKLKLKADSLLNDFQSVDIGFSGDEILIVTLVTAGGLFNSSAKKKPGVRSAMLEYFTNPEAKPDGLTAAAKKVVAKETFGQLALAQPAPVGTESLFGSIPIFGSGRIAVRLPRQPDDKNTQYLSFTLSEFRAFSMALQQICGIETLGANTEIPMTEHYERFKCHYNETPVRSLQQLEYYQKDPKLKLEISGWRCSACKLVVSEEARKREKIGGLNGKAIAKAKCPKCSQKFGSNPMYALPEVAPATTAPSDGAEEEPAPAPDSVKSS